MFAFAFSRYQCCSYNGEFVCLFFCSVCVCAIPSIYVFVNEKLQNVTLLNIHQFILAEIDFCITLFASLFYLILLTVFFFKMLETDTSLQSQTIQAHTYIGAHVICKPWRCQSMPIQMYKILTSTTIEIRIKKLTWMFHKMLLLPRDVECHCNFISLSLERSV